MAAVQITFLTQLRQRAGDRCSAEGQRFGQFSFAGQAVLQGQAAIKNNQAQRLRQLFVDRRFACCLPPFSQQTYQGGAT